jgi:DNA repair protein RecO (recombination protein O)
MKIPVYKTEGIIIGKFNSNEFDKLLVVYTKDFGKILVKAKSLRKKEAKMKSQLEIFNHVHLMLAKGKNMDTISGVALKNGFPNLRQDLNPLAAVYYICEVMDKMIVGSEQDEKIWQLVLKFLNFLEEKPRNKTTIGKLINRFEYNLLTFLGHKPEQEKKSYLDVLQYLSGERIEASVFLKEILSWG